MPGAGENASCDCLRGKVLDAERVSSVLPSAIRLQLPCGPECRFAARHMVDAAATHFSQDVSRVDQLAVNFLTSGGANNLGMVFKSDKLEELIVQGARRAAHDRPLGPFAIDLGQADLWQRHRPDERVDRRRTRQLSR